MPTEWKDTKTIVLRKPGKADYTKPKAYRLVEIASCIRRLFGAVIAGELSFQVEKHGMLPATQFGARPGRSTIDANHMVVKRIKDAWRNGRVVGGIFLDINGTFPHVNLRRLVHDMRKAGIPEEIAEWFGRLGGRRTILTFDDYRSEPTTIRTGLMQGCPSLLAAYLQYQAVLSDVPNRAKKEDSSSFVDDLLYLAEGKQGERLRAN